MAYANRTALEADVAAWLDRSDIAANIPGFISNAEANFNRTLRVQRMIERVVAQTDQPFVELPVDFLEMERLNVNNVDLTFTPPFEVDSLRDQVQWQVGRGPAFYSINGTAIELLPAPTLGVLVSLGMFYYKRIAPLVNGNESNWLLASEPDIYLYGALMQSAPFLKNDERLAVWEKMLAGAMGQLVIADKHYRRGQARLISRPGMRFP